MNSKFLLLILFLLLIVISVSRCNSTNKKTEVKPSEVSIVQVENHVIGNVIPSWVYENSVPEDAYYDVLKQSSNLILYTASDCPKGQRLKENIENAIDRAGVSSQFIMMPLLPPEELACHKFLMEVSEDEDLGDIVSERQKDLPMSQRTAVVYGDEGFCIPTAEEIKTSPEGVCSCSKTYFIEQCNSGSWFCLINPTKRRIIPMPSDDEDVIVAKLKELKDNW